MKIEGISGCYENTRGMFYFPRMCSKIRLHAAGKLPEDYFDLIGMEEGRLHPDPWREAWMP